MRNLLAFALIASLPTAGHATWSIVAVDPATGEVGSAGASCTPYVVGIARLVPGRGAIVAQAASNMHAKAVGAGLIARGKSADQIIAAIADRGFDPAFADQQYGVAVLADRPTSAAFSGAAIPGERRHIARPTFAVAGNTLASASVVDQAAGAFIAAERARLPLAGRLMAALEAGAAAGGDRRCGAKTAQSAYLGVARPGDRADRITLRLVVTTEPGDRRNPVAELRREFDAAR